MTLETLIAAAAKLTRLERAELIDALIEFDVDAPLTPVQEADLDRRIKELRSGRARMIPGHVVIAQLRRGDRNT
jgi:hypothetical protein